MTTTTPSTPEPDDEGGRPDLHLVPNEPPAIDPTQAADADKLTNLDDDLDPLDVVDDDGAVLVDTAVATAPPVVISDRRPIVPGWLASRAARLAAVRWAAESAGHWLAFHTIRLPLYVVLLVLRTPIGAGRALTAVGRWAIDTRGADMRDAVVKAVKNDARSARDLVELRTQHRRDTYYRACLVVGSVVAALVFLAAAPLATSAVLVGVLGLLGRPSGQSPLSIGRATSSDEVPRLTSDLIVAALAGLSLGKMNTALRVDDTSAVRFASPVMRWGAGWRVEIDLPIGVTADEVIARRSALASGLRRPLGCVWPEGDDSVHEGRLVLYVSDKPLSGSKPTQWPLAAKGRVNIFEAFRIGLDVRGEVVTLCLMYASVVIGALPRMGKTFFMRLLCLAAALDPRVELHIYNLKGGSDFDPLAGPDATTDPTKGVVYAYRSGDSEDDIKAALTDLRAIQAEMRRRSSLLRTLPREVCPESKVTDELASQHELGLHPILIAVDECQIWFEHPEHGKELEALSTDIVKRGPALAIIDMFATQRVDAKSLPPGIRDNAVLRFCLKVMGHIANDMVLGTGMHGAGHTATMFGRKDLGIGLLVGEGDDPIIVRTDLVDGPAADRIVARARAIRLKAGTLTGLSAGDTTSMDDSSESVLDHLAEVWPMGDDKVWCSTLAERLAETHPSIYEGWTAEQVTSAVKPHGLQTTQIKRDGRNRNGLARADLLAALANRGLADTTDDQDEGER